MNADRDKSEQPVHDCGCPWCAWTPPRPSDATETPEPHTDPTETREDAREAHSDDERGLPEWMAQKNAETAELRAALLRVHALGDAFADDGLTRHGGNIAWHIEEAIANEKGDFPDAADQRIASQRDRADTAERDRDELRAEVERLQGAQARRAGTLHDANNAVRDLRRALAVERARVARVHAVVDGKAGGFAQSIRAALAEPATTEGA